MRITDEPNVLVVADRSSGEFWWGYEELNFDTGKEVRFRRAKLFVRVEDAAGVNPDVLCIGLRIDKALKDKLGPELLAEELARQIVLAWK